VRFADFLDADTAVTAFHAGCRVEQMGATEVLGAVRQGATASALDSGMIRKTLDAVIQPLSFESTHVHLMVFTVTTHVNTPFLG
jgi:hypothetical protein